MFLFSSCSGNKETEKKEQNVKETHLMKPKRGLRLNKPVLLRYSLEDLKINDGYLLSGKIGISLKLFPDIKREEEYIKISAEVKIKADLIKTSSTDKFAFDFIINEMIIDIPGPGVNVNYNSNNVNKYLNPQIEKLNVFINKKIPVRISETGIVYIDRDTIFKRYNELKDNLSDETFDKIRDIIGYFFIIYPVEEKKSDDDFQSIKPFNGIYGIDSKMKNGNTILILAKEPIKKDNESINSFLKGWFLVDTHTGMLKDGFMKFEEKKYVADNVIKIIIIKEITIELNVNKK
jgi:hypothetical protein